MKQWLRAHFVRRKEARERNQYNNGYNYAAGILLREESTPEGIASNYAYTAMSPFDYGADEAINRLVALGFVKDDRF